ncbi:hypothetical protein [Pseudomonas syringae pv. coryli]|uniref:hypothetical protein n=1 Tax=Pseudomonas syringae pv. coryli TaxID=317659 RepID=UPI003D2DBB0E
MNVFRVAVLIVASLIISSCASRPKTEYEKKVEAIPMPATEAERLEQYRAVQGLLRSAFLATRFTMPSQTPTLASMSLYYQRFSDADHAMNCPSFDVLKR